MPNRPANQARARPLRKVEATPAGSFAPSAREKCTWMIEIRPYSALYMMISALVVRLAAASASVPKGAIMIVSITPMSVDDVSPTTIGTASASTRGTSRMPATIAGSHVRFRIAVGPAIGVCRIGTHNEPAWSACFGKPVPTLGSQESLEGQRTRMPVPEHVRISVHAELIEVSEHERELFTLCLATGIPIDLPVSKFAAQDT